MTRVGLIGGKDIGSSTGRTAGASPRSLMVFTLALTEAICSSLLHYFLDWYWLSAGPPNMKLMVGRGPGACSIYATTSPAVVPAAALRVGSLKNHLRFPAQISFFYQKFEALALIGLVAMVLVVIASQGSVVPVRTCPHWLGPFEIREVLDNGQEPVIGDVENSEFGGGCSFFFSDCSFRSF